MVWHHLNITSPQPPHPLPTPSNMPPFSTGTFSCLETSWRWSFRIIRLNSKFERHKCVHSVACLRVLIQGSLSIISQSSYDHIKQKLHQILFKYFISFICRCIWYFYCCGWFWFLMLIVDVVCDGGDTDGKYAVIVLWGDILVSGDIITWAPFA